MLNLCETQKKAMYSPKEWITFRSSTLEQHVSHHDHVNTLRADAMQGEFERAVRKALYEKEEAVLVGLKAVYWAMKEQLPMHKYEGFMSLLAQLQCPHIAQLTHGKSASYTSNVTANDMLDSIATE